jgi:hypothetical protein
LFTYILTLDAAMTEMAIKRMDIEFKEIPDTHEKVKFQPGLTYLLKEEKPVRAYFYIRQAIADGVKVMCVTRDPPEKLKEKYGLPDVQIIWLSNAYSGQALPAKSLEELGMYLGKFMAEKEGSLILIDCMEYLISNNNFGIVLKFLQSLKDRTVLNKSILLISVSPGALESQQINHIEKEMDVVV